MENATSCVNGELRPGDMVLSSPTNDYACLVGTVLYIEKAGAPDHDTGNEGDDIHVNFMDTEYSKGRMLEIQNMIWNLDGRPTPPAPGVLPPLDVDDVIMAPDMLIRITGIGREELTAILDSAKYAKQYFERAAAGTAEYETPAQAALHEPSIFEDEATAGLHRQLLERLDENLRGYFDREVNVEENRIANMSSEIAAYAGAHYYLSEIYSFHASELEYLLQYRDPLSIVADRFRIAGMDDYSDIMWDIFDKQNELQGSGYALIDDPAILDARKQELFTKLDANLSDYCNSLMSVSKAEIIDLAEDIAARYAVREYLKTNHEFRPGEIESLLRYTDPLNYIADRWPGTLDSPINLSDLVSDIIKNWTPPRGCALPTGPDDKQEQKAEEKPSVMEQLRKARAEAKENPAPRKDPPGKDHDPEL